jgi:hypothetical protein
MKPNYPGGFHAEKIRVRLYSCGRQNFRLLRFANDGGLEANPCAVDARAEANAVEFCDVLVAGLDWSGICAAANHAADQMRGCTWDQWRARGALAIKDTPKQFDLFA